MLATHITTFCGEVVEICAVKFDPDDTKKRWEFFEDGLNPSTFEAVAKCTDSDLLARLRVDCFPPLAAYAVRAPRYGTHGLGRLRRDYMEFAHGEQRGFALLETVNNVRGTNLDHNPPMIPVGTLFFDPRRDTTLPDDLDEIFRRLSMGREQTLDCMQVALDIATAVKEAMNR